MLDAILQDVRYALRALRTSPGFASVAIISLALGIGANTAIFSLIDSVILKTLPVNHPEQLLQATMAKSPVFTNPVWEQVRDNQDVFQGAFAYGGSRFNLAAGGEARYAQGNFVSGQFFDTLGLHAMAGRTLTKADDQRGCAGTAVLSNGFYQREYGGRADVIGKTVSLDNHPFEIVGVLQPGFTGFDVGNSQDIYVPLCAEKVINGETSMLDRRSAWWLRVIVRPKPGISPSRAEARLKTLAPQIFDATTPPNYSASQKERYRKNSFTLETAANGVSNVRRQYEDALLVLMAIVGVVLLIACGNVANLLLARSSARQREIAIRMALGSGRARLIRQLLTESVVLSLAGAGLGILFAQWGSRFLVSFLSGGGNTVFLDLNIDSRVLGFTIAVAVITGVLFGLAPAWRGTRVDPQSAMKANGRGVIEGSKFGIGKALVVIQVALSLVLVVGAGLMLSTFFRLENVNAGFDRERILLTSVDLRNANYPAAQRGPAFEEMLHHVQAAPGVKAASLSNMTPISGGFWNEDLQIEGYKSKGGEDMLVYFYKVSSGFFETLGTDLIAGRDFTAHDTPESPKVAIFNQTAAKRYFGAQNPIGKRYRAEEGNKLSDWVEIIGVVKDAKYGSLREEILPTAYVATSQDEKPSSSITIEVRAAASSPAALSNAVKSAILDVNPNVSLRFKTLALQVDESLSRERLLATLSGFFGGLALILAMIGLYGVMSYNVARRQNEIGIRMALGAQQAQVLRMVLREVAVLILVGLAVGIGATFGAARFVASFLFGMKATDPATMIGAAAVLASVAALAGFLPARRASRLEPMNALRDE